VKSPSPRYSAASADQRLRSTQIPLILLLGDIGFTFGGLVAGWWLRYASRFGRLGLQVNDPSFANYLPLLLVGVALLIAAFAQSGLYDDRLLLRRYQSLNVILKGSAFWLASYLGISLVLKFDPPISRLFVIMAFVCVVAALWAWRSLVYWVLVHSSLLVRLRRRAVLLGWNEEALALARELGRDTAHPYMVAGIITLSGEPAPLASSDAAQPPSLGEASNLAAILERESADLLIVTTLDLPRAEMQHVVELCEQAYVEWKVVPGTFDIFLTGLRLQTIGRVPILGIEELAIRRLFNRGLKRAIDIVGSIVGLIVFSPVMVVAALLIKQESPGGPALFRQTRVGTRHRPFTLYKLRSMTPGADATDHEHQSTQDGDARLLRIGAFLRRWNLDEVPQFWNVLRGDMSLVGPRPERPHHVNELADQIPHYLPRHLVKPGLTGWAQVNGLRGNSDLRARVRYDIYYIENWSIWLDVQVLMLTLVRWKNPAQ
jgi:exopolysaccharide biosynthesis polyprenyl glycosylphosphotransferase